jgi:beta-1,4-N-acetylglucosaminyltransferase
MKQSKTIFVTVGTTLFDQLIENILNAKFLAAACSHGYSKLIVQYGKGSMPKEDEGFQPNGDTDDGSYSGVCEIDSSNSLSWEAYRFKPSLNQDMTSADLIISHAGAGSIMEGMEQCRNRILSEDPDKRMKRLVVVINEGLMDNHQSELAEALERRGYLLMLREPNLLIQDGIFGRIEQFEPKCFSGGDDTAFGSILNEFMGDIDDKKIQ